MIGFKNKLLLAIIVTLSVSGLVFSKDNLSNILQDTKIQSNKSIISKLKKHQDLLLTSSKVGVKVVSSFIALTPLVDVLLDRDLNFDPCDIEDIAITSSLIFTSAYTLYGGIKDAKSLLCKDDKSK